MLMDKIGLIIYQLFIISVTIQISKLLLKEDIKKFNAQNLLLFIILLIINVLFYAEYYIIGELIFKTLFLSLLIRNLFEIKYSTSIATGIISSIIVVISESFYIVSANYETTSLITDNLFITLVNSVIVCLLSYYISKIIFIREVINSYLIKNENVIKKSEIIMLLFSLVIIIFFYYLILLSRYSKINKFSLVLFMIISCLMFII